MLYGWIEIGASNNTLFESESNEDIIVRTIYNNKIIMGNTSGTYTPAAAYIYGNNVGLRKVPEASVLLDVNGNAVLKEAQVGLSNTPTSLTLNGSFILKDVTKNFATPMETHILNSNESIVFKYNNVLRMRMTDGQGIYLNDDVCVTNDVYATAFQVTSDARFKKDIELSDHIEDNEIIKSLKVKDYRLKADDRKAKGFIAQELEETFPQVVRECKDLKTVDMNQITALNTSVIQSLILRIEALEKYVYDNKWPQAVQPKA